jgi:hypothetical protein
MRPGESVRDRRGDTCDSGTLWITEVEGDWYQVVRSDFAVAGSVCLTVVNAGIAVNYVALVRPSPLGQTLSGK